MRSPADPLALSRLAAAGFLIWAWPSAAQESKPFLRDSPEARWSAPAPLPAPADRDAPELRRLLQQLREEHPAEFRELQRMRLERDPEFHARLRRLLEADRTMAWLGENDPTASLELGRLRAADPERFFQRIGELRARAARNPSAPPAPEATLPPPGGRLDEIRRAYRQSADPEERKQLRGEARDVLLDHFAARRRAAQERLRRIRAETERLDQSLDQWARKRDRIIRDQMRTLFPETGEPTEPETPGSGLDE